MLLVSVVPRPIQCATLKTGNGPGDEATPGLRVEATGPYTLDMHVWCLL